MKPIHLILAASLALASPVRAADLETTTEQLKAKSIDDAGDKAIAYLMTQQRPDGSITDSGTEVAMSSLAILAMASVGHQPSDTTKEGAAMRAALDFVLKDAHQDNDGYLGRADNSRMYGHGIISLMLAEMLGQGVNDAQDRNILEKLTKAIDLTLRSQKQPKKKPEMNGGWRYTPDSSESDISVTCWHALALRAAFNKGVPVPESAIKEAIEYLKRSYKSERDETGQPLNMVSGFTYIPEKNATPVFSTTAEGLLALQVCGEYDAPEVAGAANLLLRIPPGGDWFYYGMYYYAQGMFQRGGEYAEEAKKRVPDALLPNQLADGGWAPIFDGEKAGRIYATTLSLLSLSIQWHYLPIYQR